ncbi:MAG: DUF5107 domain-containing protein [Lachnospiraceae bacterium]|nr:DUF5107 domain-containing protein [Lachnospiraceae bacterium]
MHTAKLTVETLTIPTYPEPEREALPMFAENRDHQRTSGRPYPSKVAIQVDREHLTPKDYTAVHMENDHLDLWILPEIGGRIFAAQDKSTGYDFFYRQHVIKPALIGALGSWISGGVEFNWPYHHRPSTFSPCDFTTEQEEDGTVICWLSEHEPVDRTKGMVGIVLRPDRSYLETRVKLSNRTPLRRSFLWWENAAVPVNKDYQIFFPHDVTYVNYHYLDSRISYPIAGEGVFNGIDMTEPRDISWHKNTVDATSYFACASEYDFFGGYDHGKDCGVVHIADHHISPGKKMFTWGYSQLSRSWENALTDTDGPYAELMAGTYSDNQPNFSWLEPYETKEFSQFWYPIQKIGTPDFANLACAMKLTPDALQLYSTGEFGLCTVTACAGGAEILKEQLRLSPSVPLMLSWTRPEAPVRITITGEDGSIVACYEEQAPDTLKMPPDRPPMPLAAEIQSADELYLAGVHVDQYRDPSVMPDAYWLEALRRNPRHIPSLLGMARYSYQMLRLPEARDYAERAVEALTVFNERAESGEAYYLYALILEAQGEYKAAYDNYYKAAWNEDSVSKAMVRLACLDLRMGNPKEAARHAAWAEKHNALHPLAPAVRMLAGPEHAAEIAASVLREDPLNLLVRYLSGAPDFFGSLHSEPAQSVLDLSFDLASMGQYGRVLDLLDGFADARPEACSAMLFFSAAYFKNLSGREFGRELAEAEQAPVGLTFPFRREEADVLRFAMGQGSARASLLLGFLLYDRRHYEEAGELFEQYTKLRPEDPAGYRCLAVACFSHLGRQEEALPLMKKALSCGADIQLLFETATLMDRLGTAPSEKIALFAEHDALMARGDLFTELAKAHNQNREPEKALETLSRFQFVPCEGGEHAIAEQYMFAHCLIGTGRLKAGDAEGALAAFREALTLPEHLGAGVWNRCRYVPYQFRIAGCLEKLGQKEEADAFYREIVGIQVDSFSETNLKELPYYQAVSARRTGQEQLAEKIMTRFRRIWKKELTRKDNGFFDTTPFFLSFIGAPETLRRACYLYLLGLVELFDGREAAAGKLFEESGSLNRDNLFCGWFAENGALS